MFSRRRTVATATIILAASLAVTWWVVRRKDSAAIKQFIELRYAHEIQQLETAMLEMRRSPDEDDDYAILRRTGDELRPLFDSPEFFAVNWSDDGHHGLGSVKSIPTGLAYDTFSCSPNWSIAQHDLFRGKSFDGERLFIYRGWLPQANYKREYQIVFYADKIRLQMSASKL